MDETVNPTAKPPAGKIEVNAPGGSHVISRRGAIAAGVASLFSGASTAFAQKARSKAAKPAKGGQAAVEFDGARAYEHLKAICEIGPRPSGSAGMDRQQQVLAEHFSRLKAKVLFQTFDSPHPQTREPVSMNNLIISWRPQAKDRVLLACHYDTRPLPDRDPNPKVARGGVFVGANDGASGVAFFMELGRHMSSFEPRFGVDFVLFDGEELVFHPSDPYFLGAEHFSRAYRDEPPAHRYLYGALLDMIADRQLNILYEVNSLEYARDIVHSIWNKARKLGVKEFIHRRGHEVRDDHLPLNEIAGIPTCDIIDFDYEHWHTAQDVPANCSAASLGKVGKVILGWLQDLPDEPATRVRK
ncbi:MAG: M28 family peptidase [Planctomycetaceae bacterium]|nr:MAG: M28 family peptidase [Planctomycetaceae bacterium]